MHVFLIAMKKKVRLENVLQTKLFDNVNGKKEHAKLCKNPITHRVTSTHIELDFISFFVNNLIVIHTVSPRFSTANRMSIVYARCGRACVSVFVISCCPFKANLICFYYFVLFFRMRAVR